MRYLRDIGLTISIVSVAALLIALTVVPMVAALLLRIAHVLEGLLGLLDERVSPVGQLPPEVLELFVAGHHD